MLFRSIVGAMAIEGNIYDGRTLKPQLEQVTELTEGKINKAIVDKGYKVKGGITGVDIVMPKMLKRESYYLKKKREERCRSRAGIEGLISHLKHDHRLPDLNLIARTQILPRDTRTVHQRAVARVQIRDDPRAVLKIDARVLPRRHRLVQNQRARRLAPDGDDPARQIRERRVGTPARDRETRGGRGCVRRCRRGISRRNYRCWGHRFWSKRWSCRIRVRLHPTLSIVGVPSGGIRAEDPPTSLRVFNHQLAQRGFELLPRDAPGFELSPEKKVRVFRAFERIGRCHHCLSFSSGLLGRIYCDCSGVILRSGLCDEESRPRWDRDSLARRTSAETPGRASLRSE